MNYDTFIFYGSWYNYLISLPTEDRKNLALAIIDYGCTGEIKTDNELLRGLIIGMIAPNIDQAIEKYEKSKRGGNTSSKNNKIDIDIEKIRELQRQGKTQKEIAEYYHCSDRTIRRHLAEADRGQDRTQDRTEDRTTQEKENKCNSEMPQDKKFLDF